jgi:tRNA A-37 threonylcarbamoyl transferase component Bud32
MGVVYEALDTQRGGRVALKTLPGLDPASLLLFKQEFRSLTGFSHPNVASLYELFSAEDQWFFSMEYIQGIDFDEFHWRGSEVRPIPRLIAHDAPTLPINATISSTNSLSAAREVTCDRVALRESLRQMAVALQSIHGAGIIHKDLKPANVKVTSEGRIVILDFGLASRIARPRFESATATLAVTGTVAYMSPEQAAGLPLTPATDWYAVGVMTYEALTGRRPFAGTSLEILNNKQRLDPPPAAALLRDLEDDLNEICKGLLQRDPAFRMDGQALLARLTARDTARTATSAISASPAFVGRETQLAALQESFENVQALEAARLVLVYGRSGIGKSSLVERFLERIGERKDVAILAGRCYEQESVPYKAFDSVVDALARYLTHLQGGESAAIVPRDAGALVQVFPVLGRVSAFASAPLRGGPSLDAREVRQRAFSAMRELLARLGDRKRIVLYIDDLQWGDVDSSALLREILRLPDSPSLLVIGSYRDEYEESSPFLVSIAEGGLGEQVVSRVNVGPLDSDESLKLAERYVGPGRLSPEQLAGIARESGGSPYFLSELAGAFRSTPETAAQASSTLDSVLQRRVRALPAGVRALAEVVAVSGKPIAERHACNAANLEEDIAKALVMLRTGRLIRGAAGAIEPWHDRVRETILAHMDAATLQRHHMRLALVMEAASESDSEAIAIHYENGGQPRRAAPHYATAAQRATAALAFQHAAVLFQKALTLSGAEGAERRKLTVQLADALANAGRGFDAAQCYGEAAMGLPAAEALALQRKEAIWYAVSGYMDEGRVAFVRVLARVGMSLPRGTFTFLLIILAFIRLRLRGLQFTPVAEPAIPPEVLERLDIAWEAGRSFSMMDPPRGLLLTARSLMLGLKAGASQRIAASLCWWNAGQVAMRGVPRAVMLPGSRQLAAQLVRQASSPYLTGFHHVSQGLQECCAGNWRACAEHMNAGSEILRSECSGTIFETSTAQNFSLLALEYMGRYREIIQVLGPAVAEAKDKGNLYQQAVIGMGVEPFLEMVAGRPESARRKIDEALQRWARTGYYLQNCFAAKCRVELHLYCGEAEAAWKAINNEWPVLRKWQYLRLMGMCQFIYFTRAQCALALGVRSKSRASLIRDASRDAKWLGEDITPYAHALANVVRAGCTVLKGNLTAARVLLEDGAKGLDAADMTILAATVRWRLGQMTPGPDGTRIQEQAEARMRAEGVVEPARFADVFVNGFTAR